ncbi:hypothetical protein PG985_015997 [Apiospora marii]|uniref:uncharacterized protein n=1 Tax=Apiospora marii TaxID=335849 RepID=UPI00313254BF
MDDGWGAPPGSDWAIQESSISSISHTRIRSDERVEKKISAALLRGSVFVGWVKRRHCWFPGYGLDYSSLRLINEALTVSVMDV